MWRDRTKLRRFAVTAVTATLLLSCWLYWNREPRYRGMRASSYVLQLIGPASLPNKSPHDGIREMGPELAVPALVRVIRAQDSSLARRYRILYAKIPASVRNRFPAPSDRDRVIATAFIALAQFGAEASSAVPDLIQMYDHNPSGVTSALRAIGPSASNAIPTLISGLDPMNTFLGPSALCHSTAAALWRIDPTGDLTATALSRNQTGGALQAAVRAFGLQELNSRSRFGGASSCWTALELLGCARSEAKQTAPIIAHFLHDDNERIRAKAAETLGRLGPVVREQVKGIRPLLLDDWQMVREAATNALKAIESR